MSGAAGAVDEDAAETSGVWNNEVNDLVGGEGGG